MVTTGANLPQEAFIYLFNQASSMLLKYLNLTVRSQQNWKPLGYYSVTGLPPHTGTGLLAGCRQWLTCWSWPGSASPWRWEWACGTWVRPGIPALGWTGRETWWPGTWSEGRGRKWWGCRPDPLFLAPHISLSMRRRLPLVPGEICWNQKVILLPIVGEKNTAAIRSPARSGN